MKNLFLTLALVLVTSGIYASEISYDVKSNQISFTNKIVKVETCNGDSCHMTIVVQLQAGENMLFQEGVERL